MTLPWPPLLPPPEWWRRLASILLRGEPLPDDLSLGTVAPRDALRFRIAGGVTLSVPVAGGAPALKRGPAPGLLISSHGRWTNSFAGALETAYGRTPFFRHFAPPLLDLIGDTARSLDAGNPPEAALFCREAFNIALAWTGLDNPDTLRHAAEAIRHNPRLVEARRADIAPRADLSLSIADAAFRLGPETIFLLLPTFNLKDSITHIP